MKKFILCVFLVLWFGYGGFFSAEASALTQEEIMVLMSKFDIDVESLQEFRDPFWDYRDSTSMIIPPEEDIREDEPQTKDDEADAAKEKERKKEESLSPPAFQLQGLVRRGGRELAVLLHEGDTVLVHKGEEYEGYRFSTSNDRAVVFKYEGRHYTLQIGGQ